MGKQVYPISRGELAKFVVNDLKKTHRWDDDDNYIFSSLRHAPVDIKFSIHGSSADLRDVEVVIANNGGSSAVIDDQDVPTRDTVGGSRPIEIWTQREIYILQRALGSRNHSSLMIMSRGDRTRLYHRELEVYNEIDHEGAAALRALILKEHPDVDLAPLG